MKLRSLMKIGLLVLGMMLSANAWAAKVDINTASVEQLESVKYIGPKLAAAIVEYRESHGAFKSVDDLVNVHGIGDKTLAKFKDEVEVGE